MDLILYLAGFFLLLALVLFWQANRTRQASGLPGGRLIYTDTRGWGKLERPLYDGGLGLTGKPDYLVQQDGKYIPVEVKSGRAPEAPYDSHLYQLAAYCFLVEKHYGVRPPYGIIHYENRDFAVDYTYELENSFLNMIAEIRRDERRADVDRSHDNPARCARCGFREVCDQKL